MSFFSSLLAKRLSLVVPILYMGLILLGSSIPAHNGASTEKHFLDFLLLPNLLQNLLHIPAYALLAFFWRWSLNRYLPAGNALILALVLTIVLGMLQEWYQNLIPGRYVSLSDVFFNSIGAVAGVWVYSLLYRLSLK